MKSNCYVEKHLCLEKLRRRTNHRTITHPALQRTEHHDDRLRGNDVDEQILQRRVTAHQRCAAKKGGINIYVAAKKDEVPLATIYKKRLGKTNNGRNCIRFKRLADISMDELRNAVLDAVEWGRVQETIYGRNCAQPVGE